MFARNASFRLKSINLSSEFTQTFENEIIPLLRKQKGFIGELALANPGSMERIAISLWESKADADAYRANAYPEVLKILAKTIEGTPKVHTFDNVTSTFHGGA
ncbi:MAG TPA: hypothetical protein VMU45_13365 [Candidatus Eisenbacteria bacterium]|nr:hypothetical protein [Candidatus Eisenbacteria bacterium]